MVGLIKPKPITVSDIDGNEYDFIISRLPATVGREVVATYPISAMPKIGEYEVNQKIAQKMLRYVVRVDDYGNETALKTQALIDNHCADWQVHAKLEMAMLEYNTSFFGNGKVSKFLDGLSEKAQQWIIKTLTDFSAQSSGKDSRPSKN